MLKLVKAAASTDPSEAILVLANVVEKLITHVSVTEKLAETNNEQLAKTLAVVIALQESVYRIEVRLRTNESATARATSQHEIVEEFARVALDEKRDQVQARREARAEALRSAGKIVGFFASSAGLGLVLSFALKACG
jgi:hypothetical protein